MKIHFRTSYVRNSKFKLHRMRKFCRTYELQYTHCNLGVKTYLYDRYNLISRIKTLEKRTKRPMNKHGES